MLLDVTRLALVPDRARDGELATHVARHARSGHQASARLVRDGALAAPSHP